LVILELELIDFRRDIRLRGDNAHYATEDGEWDEDDGEKESLAPEGLAQPS
jgi:hypothetical protein